MHLHLTSKIIQVSLFAAVFCPEAFGHFPDSSFPAYADSVFAHGPDTQITVRRIREDVHTYFMVTTCKTVGEPFSSVVGKLRNYRAYPEYFSFIMKTVEVENKDGDVTMFVGRYGLYRVYFFGKIREEWSGDSGRFRIHCGDVDQKRFRKTWRKRIKGLIKIGSHDVDIYWTAEKRDENSTRLSLTASQAFTTRIPNWMVSIGTNRIFRGMLKDIELYLARKRGNDPGGPLAEPVPEPVPVPPAAPMATESTGTAALRHPAVDQGVTPPAEADTAASDGVPATGIPASGSLVPDSAPPADAVPVSSPANSTRDTAAPLQRE